MTLELIIRLIVQTALSTFGIVCFYAMTTPFKERVTKTVILNLSIFLFIAFIILPLVNYNTRIFYSIGIFIISQVIYLKHNIFQTFISLFIMMVIGLILDSVFSLFLLNGLHYEVGNNAYGADWIVIGGSTFLNVALVGFTWIFKDKIRKVIIKSNHLKNYQITLSLFVTTLMFLYVLWVNFYVLYGNTQSMVVQIIMLVLVIIVAIVILYVSDQYMKKKNENIVLKERVSSMTKNQNGQLKGKSEFEKSVEFDLFSSSFGEKVSENYQLEGVLYESENSLIYKLKGLDSEPYTLKAISKDKMETVDSERLKSLNINQIAQLIEYSETNRFHYFLKPFIKGINLHEHVKANGPMAEKQLIDVLKQLMIIISALHEQLEPFIYRDIKPSNLIIDKAGKLHLIDIETIRVQNSKREMDTILIATKGFTAPEQYGFSQSHEKSDVFSIGATAYFLATGKSPSYEEIHNSDLVTRDNISPKLFVFIRKCMQFNPEDRYGSVKEASEAFV